MEMKITLPGGTRVDAEYKGFAIRTDQPVRHGGSGTLPAPFDYFLASLGTCAGFYVLSFLERRGLPIADVSLTLSTATDPESHRVTDVTIKVTLPSGFPEKYRRAIVAAVDQCSVKKHLLAPPSFHTEVQIGEREAA